MNIEPHLRRALAPASPPRGFAERVMARVQVEAANGRYPLAFRRRVSRAWVALAASLALAVTGGVGYLERARRLEGERARTQFIEALQVTRAVLDAVQRSVADREPPPGERN